MAATYRYRLQAGGSAATQGYTTSAVAVERPQKVGLYDCDHDADKS